MNKQCNPFDKYRPGLDSFKEIRLQDSVIDKAPSTAISTKCWLMNDRHVSSLDITMHRYDTSQDPKKTFFRLNRS